ncbi:MAG: helix-turn-helix domain-containing protein [Methylocella sp.]
MRAEIVLLAADGMNNCAIAATLGVSRLTVGPWRKRFAKKRFDGLDDEPRRGAPRKIDAAQKSPRRRRGPLPQTPAPRPLLYGRPPRSLFPRA